MVLVLCWKRPGAAVCMLTGRLVAALIFAQPLGACTRGNISQILSRDWRLSTRSSEELAPGRWKGQLWIRSDRSLEVVIALADGHELARKEHLRR